MGSSAGHGTNGHAADQINKLKSKALALKVINMIIPIGSSMEYPPGGYFGVKRIGMTIGNPRKLP